MKVGAQVHTVLGGQRVRRGAPIVTTPVEPPVTPPTTTVAYGSVPVGEASYTVPAGALYVSPSGSNSNPGTLSLPLQTAEYALANAATSGKTVVLRGGTYREGRIKSTLVNGTALTCSQQGVTLINAPGEAVWIDGTVPISASAFTLSSGRYWTAWTPRDRSPQYTSYASSTVYNAAIASGDWKPLDGSSPDSTSDIYWEFVDYTDPLRACAAWPERVWLDGIQLTQTYTYASLSTGEFFVDAATNRLWLYDNPTGKSVSIASLQKSFNWLAADQSMMGIGIRGYATSNPMLCGVTAHRPRFRAENVWFKDNGAASLGIVGSNSGIGAYDSEVVNTTIERGGNLGLILSQADRVTCDAVALLDSNDRCFNPAPSAGALKATKFNDLTVKNSKFDSKSLSDPSAPNRRGHGKLLWTDQQCRGVYVTGNLFKDSGQRGIVYEISCDIIHAGNVHVGIGTDGIVPVSSNRVSILNNTFMQGGRLRGAPETVNTDTYANPRPVNMMSEARVNYLSGPFNQDYMDRRYITTQDSSVPTLTPYPSDGWTPDVYLIANNVIVDNNGQCYLADEDLRHDAGTAVGIGSYHRVVDYNLYQPLRSGTGPAYPWTWTSGPSTQANAQTIASLRTQLGWETHGVVLPSTDPLPVDSNGVVTDSSRHASAMAIPSNVAAALGVASGTKRWGPFPPPSTLTGWRAMLAAATPSSPARISFLGDSITFGAGAPGVSGNSNPHYMYSYPGQFRSAIVATKGNPGTGWVLANHDLITTPAYDDRVACVGTITKVQRGPHKYSCYGIPDGGATTPSSYVTFTASCTSFRILVLAKAAGDTSKCMVSIDGGTPKALRNVVSGGTSNDIERLSGTHAYHIVTEIPAGSFGTHTLKVWGNGGTVELAAWEAKRASTGSIVVDNLGISGRSLQSFMDNVSPAFNSDEATGRYGLPFIDTFNMDGASKHLLVVALGTNDYNVGYSLSRVQAWLQTLIDRQQANGGSVVLWFPPISNPALYPGGGAPTYADYVNLYQTVATAKGVEFNNDAYLWGTTFAIADAVTPQKYVDHSIHPTDSGAADIATSWRSFTGI